MHGATCTQLRTRAVELLMNTQPNTGQRDHHTTVPITHNISIAISNYHEHHNPTARQHRRCQQSKNVNRICGMEHHKKKIRASAIRMLLQRKCNTISKTPAYLQNKESLRVNTIEMTCDARTDRCHNLFRGVHLSCTYCPIHTEMPLQICNLYVIVVSGAIKTIPLRRTPLLKNSSIKVETPCCNTKDGNRTSDICCYSDSPVLGPLVRCLYTFW